ncbi:MAG: DUF167 domain-containing protein [Rickettsiales bacterium]|nr:DUF167 domain-containing protein [Rickettsiales bacterium]
MTEFILAIHAVPKSSKSEIVGWIHDNSGRKALKVRLAAPPEDGKANEELIRFLAKSWGITKSRIQLAAGAASRHKILKIQCDNQGTPPWDALS